MIIENFGAFIILGLITLFLIFGAFIILSKEGDTPKKAAHKKQVRLRHP